MRLRRFYTSASLVFLSLDLISADSDQTVDLGYAIYQGFFNDTSNITSFLGLRYAHPPIGELRFQAPRDPLMIHGIQNATTLGQGCPQGAQGMAASSELKLANREIEQIEDCLFANVYVSGSVSANARMPVIVWIHGGGYVGKTIRDTDGGDLIRDGAGGVVVVEIAYRLGLFGFLSSKEVKEYGVLNAGLLDQEYALKWVQKHIKSFGGDPKKVTIWGESAGAGSVLQHMVAHEGNAQPPLFRTAMTSSAFLPSQYRYDDSVPEVSRVWEEASSCTGIFRLLKRDPSRSENASNRFACLVSADPNALEAANIAICEIAFYGSFAFVPVVHHGEFIVERPTKTITRGKLNGDVLLSVTNSYEGRTFVDSNFTSNTTFDEYVHQLFPTFGEEQIKTTIEQYTGIGLTNLFYQSVAIMGESIFICPTYTLLHGFQGPSFKGELAVPPANHGSDTGYYMPSNRAPPIPNAQLSAFFAGSFLGIVKAFSPNRNPLQTESITPYWAEFRAESNQMLFNITQAGDAQVHPFKKDQSLLKRCEFWRSVEEYTNQ